MGTGAGLIQRLRSSPYPQTAFMTRQLRPEYPSKLFESLVEKVGLPMTDNQHVWRDCLRWGVCEGASLPKLSTHPRLLLPVPFDVRPREHDRSPAAPFDPVCVRE